LFIKGEIQRAWKRKRKAVRQGNGGKKGKKNAVPTAGKAKACKKKKAPNRGGRGVHGRGYSGCGRGTLARGKKIRVRSEGIGSLGGKKKWGGGGIGGGLPKKKKRVLKKKGPGKPLVS